MIHRFLNLYGHETTFGFHFNRKSCVTSERTIRKRSKNSICTSFSLFRYSRKLIVGKPLRCKLGMHASPKVVWEYPFNCKLCGALVEESERITGGKGGDDD